MAAAGTSASITSSRFAPPTRRPKAKPNATRVPAESVSSDPESIARRASVIASRVVAAADRLLGLLSRGVVGFRRSWCRCHDCDSFGGCCPVAPDVIRAVWPRITATDGPGRGPGPSVRSENAPSQALPVGDYRIAVAEGSQRKFLAHLRRSRLGDWTLHPHNRSRWLPDPQWHGSHVASLGAAASRSPISPDLPRCTSLAAHGRGGQDIGTISR
jgi:hypothetical protein